MKGVEDSLAQPSKATNFSTNVSQERNTHRLPGLKRAKNTHHLRINSLIGESVNTKHRKNMNLTGSSNHSTSTRHVRTSISPYRHQITQKKLSSKPRMNLSSYGQNFPHSNLSPIRIQDPTPAGISFEQTMDGAKNTDTGMVKI